MFTTSRPDLESGGQENAGSGGRVDVMQRDCATGLDADLSTGLLAYVGL